MARNKRFREEAMSFAVCRNVAALPPHHQNGDGARINAISDGFFSLNNLRSKNGLSSQACRLPA